MTVQQKRVASLILREHYGEIVEKVGTFCIAKGLRPLKDITRGTKLPQGQVQKALCCLIQHHFVTFEVNKRNVTLYNAWISNILLRLRAPRYIYCVKSLFGYTGELIIDEIFQHGSAIMSTVVDKVARHLQEDDIDSEEDEIRVCFADLVKNHFLQRLRPMKSEEQTMGNNSYNEDDLYALPPGMNLQGVVMKCHGSKRKRSTGDEGQTAKRQKTGASYTAGARSSELSDDGILWQVNFARFHQHFIDENIVTVVTKKVDKFAGEIVKTMLKLTELARDPLSPTSQTVSLHEISQNLSVTPKMEKAQIVQYLSLLTDEKIGELAMIPSKDVKELLYKLFAERFIALQEIPRASDYAPSRTVYLFSVNLPQLSRMLLEKSYQALGNLMSRRETEIQEHRRLIEKKERVEATINTLKAQHGEETSEEAIAELREFIIPAEQEQLKKLKLSLAKLDQSELQVDETIFILSQYISSH
ncbi:hypothetical protein pdam_00000804 [Pocillopora damicornis]|uniref:DNA-directed RNA polymerase III subunit RPC3 n=1 Tax=Pocillopora damicornis TaxID=46731 RepID=A0A3M6TVC2_POCDA|nr:hypothetical protein pdam_00000804 [Pocillopora damicornis]